MLLVYVAAASLAVGLLRGGRFRYFSQTPFYGLWLPILAFGLEAAIGPLVTAIPGSPDRWLWLVVLGEYLLLAAFLWCNRHLKPIWLLAAGTVANFAVISLNQWKMPVSRAILEMPQLSEFVEKMTTGTLVEYALITDSTRLWWLGDVIHFDFVPGMSFASVGDFLLGAGIFWLLQKLMFPPRDASPSTEG